jgi:flavin-dependent dehydrogenase
VEPEYDVVIVGARVAGASLGILLARQGRRVLLLDRDAFPSDTLSTHYTAPDVVQRLAALGVLDGLLEAGFRRVTRHRTVIENCVLEGPAGPGGAFALSPRRNVLDALLQERTVGEGAELRTRTNVERLLVDGETVVGVVAAGEEIRARVVVGADGKASKVADWVGAESYREVPAQRPAYYGYFHGVAPQPEPTLEMHFGGDAIGFLFPMRPGEDCLALELQPEDFDAFRADPFAMFLDRYSRLQGMEERLRGATLEGKLKGIKGVANYFRVPYGPGWALTGDAAYLKDFATGLGIGDAAAQAFWLAEALGEWFDGAGWDETLGAFQRRRDETLLPSYEATLAFVRMADPLPERIDVLRALLAAPGLTRSLGYALPETLGSVLPEPQAAMAAGYAGEFRKARQAEEARA